ncbi:EF-hand domain-containing protein D2 [Lingula anatina]|uniref:EF-hand domain-containing protein D2 n=1 Tax=Lingula anatina TaxID=7574 RepID=A0A2R2MSW3_LINAN|nr:EF-hand domain-containing protein D2 [Lingula anatina]|eukprot:XP_023933218.1 EF-hand domain-containing protein D2 [Lingula anatina]
MASNELAKKLERRMNINEGEEEPAVASQSKVFNPYTEFKEFTRKQIQNYQKMFNEYDVGKDKFIDFEELKRMMEKLGAPQTHLALKEMIHDVDEDKDNMINFREFLLIFRKAAAGELAAESGLYEIYTHLSEIDVDKEGVKGAKNFFEAKIDQQTQEKKFEEEIRQEQEEKRIQQEEKKERQQAFKAKTTFFKQEIENQTN